MRFKAITRGPGCAIPRLILGGMLAAFFLTAAARAAPGDLLLSIPQPEGPSGGLFGTFFGHSLATGDGYIVVGAEEETVAGVRAAGAAYVFDAWTGELMHRLTSLDPNFLSKFGHTVAIDSGRVIVGPSGDFVDIFDVDSGEHLTSLSVSGKALAASGGKILTGNRTLHVDGMNSVGGAYLFDARTGDLELPLPNPFPAPHHEYGVSVAFSRNRPVIGAHFYDATEMTNDNSGRVYVLDPMSGEPVVILENPDPQPDAILPRRFGENIATTGDKIIVGATNSASFGFAYAFDGATGELLFRISKPTPGRQVEFAENVATVGGNILVTESRDEIGGSVYLFDGQTGELLLKISNPDPEAGTGFGRAVTALDGDIVVGTWNANTVYVFEGVPDIPVGDTDGDGDVDIDDLNAVRNHFGRVGADDGTLPGDTWPYNGAVDITDLNRTRNYFGNARGTAAAVPEPAALLLATLTALVALTARRSR